MQTVRRVYLYLVSFISFLTCLWAAIGLALNLIDPPPASRMLVIQLAGMLSALIVAIPFYLIHWLIAQRHSRENTDERSTNARSIYHYGLMLVTAASALIAGAFLLNDLLSLAIGGRGAPALADIGDDLVTQLIIMVFNAVAWFYARRHAAADHRAIPEQGGRGTIHRTYRYLFLSAGLALTGSGIGSLLLAILEPQASTTEPWQSLLASGLTNLLIGAPLWITTWLAAQDAFASGGEEAESVLRKTYLYLVNLVGCLASVTSAAGIVSLLLQRAMGVPARSRPLMADLASPIAIIIVSSVIWVYHSRILSADAASVAEGKRQRGFRRLYHYLLAAVGIIASLSGAFGLVSVLAAALGGGGFTPLRINLSNSLASLAAGLPLWLIPWNLLQRNSLKVDEMGDEARGSLIRRIYLYLFVFVGVIGSLISGAGLINLLLRLILGAQPETPIVELAQNSLALILSGVTLAYHLRAIQGDGKRQRTSRAESLTSFPVVLIGPSSWTSELVTVLRRMLPGMPIECSEAKQASEALGGTKAAVLPSSLLATDSRLRKQLDSFKGFKVVVPHHQPGWAWASAPQHDSTWKEAQDISPLLEMAAMGEQPRAKRKLGAWGVVGVVLATLLGLLVLLPMTINLIEALS